MGSGVRYAYGQASYIFTQSQWGSYPFALGDFNGDGILDAAAVSTPDKTVTVLLGKPDGTMTISSVIPFTQGIGGIAAGDFNRDGRQDLVVTDGWDSQVLFLLSNGDGTFRAPVAFATSFDPETITVADVNGDGRLDLVVLIAARPTFRSFWGTEMAASSRMWTITR
jgi:hypothetical protein